MLNILQHNIERFGMVTVMDVMLFDITTNAPVLQLDTLKMTNISVEAEAKEIRGGIGNDMLINFDFGRTANIEMQDALVSPDSIAFLWGSQATAAAAVQYDVVETYQTASNGALTFVETVNSPNAVFVPASGTKIYVLAADGSEGKHWGALTKSGSTVTITFTDSENDEVEAFTGSKAYKVFFQRTSAAGRQIVLQNDNFPTAVKMVGTTFVIDQDSGKKKLLQIIIPKLKINSNFSFTMDAEGDASVFDFNGVALSDGGQLIIVKYLGNY